MIIGEAEAESVNRAMRRDRVPPWAAAAIGVLFCITGFCLSSAWNRAEEAARESACNSSRTSVLESQINGLKQWMEKVDSKMDKVLDEMRKR